MHKAPKIFILLCVLSAFTSCERISALLQGDDAVAKVGRHRLYRSEVEALIPSGISPEDSLNIARSYINTWASDLVYLNTAQQKLSKSDKNLNQELEQYKNALLKYRLEQLYISENLDTSVSEQQIKEYYDNNSESLSLVYPIVKAKFIRLTPGSVELDKVKDALSGDDPDNQLELDNIIYSCSERYDDFGGNWVEITDLASEFRTDYGTLLAQMSNSFIVIQEPDGHLNVAYIDSLIRSGNVPPLEFCREKIYNVIISVRKQQLLSQMEEQLLSSAREAGLFQIFDKE